MNRPLIVAILLISAAPLYAQGQQPDAAKLKADAHMIAEKFESQHEGWRTLWLTIAGVMAITLTWNVLMLSLNGISY
jgi:hypothetical protein